MFWIKTGDYRIKGLNHRTKTPSEGQELYFVLYEAFFYQYITHLSKDFDIIFTLHDFNKHEDPCTQEGKFIEFHYADD